MINVDMLKETAEHFSVKKEQKDNFSEFKKIYANGQAIVDLTSIDEEYEPVKLRYQDIERERIYGRQAGDPNKM